MLRRLVDSPAFAGAIIAVIVANAIVLGLETYEGVDRRWGDTLDLLDTVFLWIFVGELTLRIASYWPRPQEFFRGGWNMFDFVVIGVAFVPGLAGSSTLLRLARLARVVRVVRLLPDVRVLLVGVLRSLPPLASIAGLTGVVLFVYGMIGWQLFGDELPGDWGNIGRAMLTLFVMLTLENFPVYMDRGMDVEPWSWVYFVSFILVAAFVVLNVLIGIVLNSMEEAREIERRKARGMPEPGLDDPHLAPVMERIAILRSALQELEEELGQLRRR
jgi:voltage-gated sodium channel